MKLHPKNKPYLLKLLLLLTKRLYLHQVIFIIITLTSIGCGKQASKPSIIVNEEPIIYDSTYGPKARQTQLNIESLAGFKLADVQLQLTLKEGDYDTQVLLENADNVLLDAMFHQPYLNGLCIDTQSNSMAFFIRHVAQGIGLQQEDLLLKNAQGQWQLTSLYFNEFNSNVEEYTQCATPESTSHWEDIATNPSATICHCSFPESIFAEPIADQWRSAIGDVEPKAIFELDESFDIGKTNTISLYDLAKPDELESLIQQARQDSMFEVIQLNQNAASLLIVNYLESPYKNVGYGFIRISSNSEWRLWYTAGDSSKKFNPISHPKKIENGMISMELCIRDCSWWGKQASITLDLEKMTFKHD